MRASSLKGRFALLLLVFGLTVGLTVGLSTSTSRLLQDRFETLNARGLPRYTLALAAETRFGAIQRALEDAAVLGESAFRERAGEQHRILEGELDRLAALSTGADEAMVAHVKRDLQAYFPAASELSDALGSADDSEGDPKRLMLLSRRVGGLSTRVLTGLGGMVKTAHQTLSDDLKDSGAELQANSHRLLQVGVVGVVVLLALLGYFVVSILAPVRALGAAFEEIAAGNLDARAGVDGGATSIEEFTELLAGFHAMADQLSITTVSRGFFDSVIRSMGNGLLVTDPNGEIKMVNEASCAMTGLREQDLLGRQLRMVLLQSAGDGRATTTPSGEAPFVDHQGELLVAGGDRLPVVITVAPLRDDSGGRKGAVYVVQDDSQRREIDRIKDDFVATVSHELRTPLTSIRGALGILSGGSTEGIPPAAAKLLEVAERNSLRLILLIDDLLDVEKIASGNVRLEPQSTPLGPLLDQVLEEAAGLATAHDVTFELEFSAGDAIVHVDRNRLLQVINNLLSNAAKFSKRGDQVELSWDRDEGQVRISVRDYGSGIPEEFRESVFDRFTQADSSASRLGQGAGLGLSIARSLVTMMGGTIGFDTETGVGTTFYVLLPESDREPVSPS